MQIRSTSTTGLQAASACIVSMGLLVSRSPPLRTAMVAGGATGSVSSTFPDWQDGTRLMCGEPDNPRPDPFRNPLAEVGPQ